MRSPLIVCTIALLCASHASADCIARTFDLPHLVVPNTLDVETFGGSFPGAIQWMSAPDPACDPIAFEVRTVAGNTPIDVEIVRSGPLLVAWRVPDVPAGTIVGATQSCGDSSFRSYGPVQVTAGEAIERAAPTIDALTVTGTDSLELAAGCDDTIALPDFDAVSRVTTTLFAAGVTTDDSAVLLVDAWLLDGGSSPRPSWRPQQVVVTRSQVVATRASAPLLVRDEVSPGGSTG